MQHGTRPSIALPLDVRPLLEAPDYVHLPTLRADGRPRNHVVRAGLEGVRDLICTSDRTCKGKDMRRDPRVALPAIDRDNPYRMAALRGRAAEERPDQGCRLMDPISIKYTGAPFPSRGPGRACFVIAVEQAAQHTEFRAPPRCGFSHQGLTGTSRYSPAQCMSICQAAGEHGHEPARRAEAGSTASPGSHAGPGLPGL